MVTGGFRTRAGMIAALEGGELDVVGIGRPLIADPLTPAKLLTGEIERAPAPEASINLFQLMGWFNMQLERMSDGLDPDLALDSAGATAEFKELEQGYTAALLARRAGSLGQDRERAAETSSQG